MSDISRKLKKILKQWGFGEVEADIFAHLSTSDGLTAKEISDKIGYAYSTTINSLNNLIRMGYVERSKKERKFVYFANLDFVKIIEREISKTSNLLKELKNEICKLEDKYKSKLRELVLKIEHAIKYLEARG